VTALGIAGLLALLAADAVLVIAEYSLAAAPRAELEQSAAEGRRGARAALALIDEPGRFVGTVQVAITTICIALGALGVTVLRELLDPLVAAGLSFVLALAIVTYVGVVVGELAPKAIGLHHAAGAASVLARPIAVLEHLARPLLWLLRGSARVVLTPLRVPPAPAGATVHTVEELRGIVAEAEDSGLIREAEEEMLFRVFDFAGQEAADVMVPWSEVVILDASLTVPQAVSHALEAPHSRFPVVRGSIDDVAGFIALRDLTSAMHGGDERPIEVLVRDLLVVPQTKDVGALLQEMRQSAAQMALVVGEYGQTLGIVTLNDLVEEIVGEIEEEYGLPDEAVEQLPDGRLRVAGSFTGDDFNETFDTDLPTEDYRTLGGLVFGDLGRAPRRGDVVTVAGVELSVERVEGPRIERLLVRLPQREDSGDAGGRGV